MTDVIRKYILVISVLVFGTVGIQAKVGAPVLLDSVTCRPLSAASVFNSNGKFLGVSGTSGQISCVGQSDFPITIRYMGYEEVTVPEFDCDTIFMSEKATELPEVMVLAKGKKALHILAYVREYSTLSTYTDTVSMFREKMVDFMLPDEPTKRFLGWRSPRLLTVKSYFRFTNSEGLDSVSDRYHNYFSWSNWVKLPYENKLPTKLLKGEYSTDTIYGKYSPTEIWVKSADRLSINIDVLADTVSRKWVSNMNFFFRNQNVDYEQFCLRMNYANVLGESVSPLDLTGYSYNIDSRGRARNMFRFNHVDEPYFVTTYVEVYVLDREFISIKEAKQWERRSVEGIDEILVSEDAPDLQPDIQQMITRVDDLDYDKIRLSITPDARYISKKIRRRQNFGDRAFTLLKQLTGVTRVKYHRNMKNQWRSFQHKQVEQNRQNVGKVGD